MKRALLIIGFPLYLVCIAVTAAGRRLIRVKLAAIRKTRHEHL